MGNCRNSPEMHGKPMLSAIKTQNDLKMGKWVCKNCTKICLERERLVETGNYIKANGNIWKYGRILNSIPERASKDIKRGQKGSKRLKKPIKFQGKCKKSGINIEFQDEKFFQVEKIGTSPWSLHFATPRPKGFPETRKPAIQACPPPLQYGSGPSPVGTGNPSEGSRWEAGGGGILRSAKFRKISAKSALGRIFAPKLDQKRPKTT